MPKKYINIILIALVLLGAFYLYNKYRVAPTLDFNKLSLVDLQGNPFDFNSLKGQKTIVSLGASWCPNCINELNAIKKIKDIELSDVVVVVIDDEPLDKVNAFKERKNYPFLFVKLNGSFPDIGIHSIPVNYIFNKDLVLKKQQVGEIHWDDPSTLAHYKTLME